MPRTCTRGKYAVGTTAPTAHHAHPHATAYTPYPGVDTHYYAAFVPCSVPCLPSISVRLFPRLTYLLSSLYTIYALCLFVPCLCLLICYYDCAGMATAADVVRNIAVAYVL